MSATASDLLLDAADRPEGLGAPPGEIAARSPLALFWRRLRHDKVALTALVFIVVLILAAVLAPVIVDVTGAHQPNLQHPEALDEFGSAIGPNFKQHFYMGTDGLGRDVFSRILYGARVSLEVAFIATGIGVAFGVLMGMVAGYYRGWVDTLLSRAMDVLLGFPVLLLGFGLGAACSLKGCIALDHGLATFIIGGLGLAVALVQVALYVRTTRIAGGTPQPRDAFGAAGVGLGIILVAIAFRLVFGGGNGALIEPGLKVVIFIIAFSTWPYVARIIRGQVLSLREREFIDAARSLGAPNRRIIFKEILPNLVPPIIVYTTLIIPTNILFEAALSFLGVGIEPPDASWGSMIASAVDIFDTAWWFMLFPGLALLFTVLAFNLVGDGLQDALNPRGGK
jgi:peptide/nickel transport system permease protein